VLSPFPKFFVDTTPYMGYLSTTINPEDKMEIIEGIQPGPWMILIYGVPGIGKSTLASLAKKPLFIDCEGGISRINAHKTPRIYDMKELHEALDHKSAHQTIVIDTVDGVEEIVRKHVLYTNGWKNLEQAGYGKGHGVFAETFGELITKVEQLKARKKNIIWIGHDQIKPFASPDAESYDRYIPKMAKNIVGQLVGRCDAVFFCQHEHLVKTDKTNEDRVRGIGTGKRLIRTCETPAWIAKNRFNLAPTLPMDGSIFEQLV
jgi:hypothetical protein